MVKSLFDDRRSPRRPVARQQTDRSSAREIVRAVRRGERNPFPQGSPEGIAYAFTEQLKRHAGAGRSPLAASARKALDSHDPEEAIDVPPVPGLKPPAAERTPAAAEEERPPLPGDIPPRLMWRQDALLPVSVDFADAIDKAEQSHGRYDIVHYDGDTPTAWGRYQFTRIGLQEVGLMDGDGNWIHPGFPTAEDFLNDPAAQDAALARLLAAHDEQFRRKNLRIHLGQEVNGIVGRFVVTEAGMQAAAHREGAGALSRYLRFQAEHGWTSDFSGLDADERAIFEHVETRLRLFSDERLRSGHVAPLLVTEIPVR